MSHTPSVVSHTAEPAASGHCTLLLNQKGELEVLSLRIATRKPTLLSPTWIESFTSPALEWILRFYLLIFCFKKGILLHTWACFTSSTITGKFPLKFFDFVE